MTGLGAVTPLGICVKDTWKRLIAGDCGIVNIQSHLDDDRFNGIPSKIAGLVPGFKPSAYVSIDARRMARFTQLALAAAEEALTDSGLSLQSAALKESTGVCIGSGIGSFEDAYDTSIKFHQQGYHKVSPLFIPRLLTNMAAGHMSIHFGFQGPSHTVSTACTTGAHAIGDASRFISHGDANVMVAGASESCIHPLALAGFARSRSLSTSFNEEPTQASRPFDAARDGFVIAEGAGIMVLEEREHALRRDARVYAEVRGYGLSSDASHLIAPHPQGEGAFLSMTRAINDARLIPAEIDYVNAHATSTRLGDRVENDAIKRVLLGPGGKSSADQLNISSTKGATGHLLGAAGAVEALFTVLSLYNVRTAILS